MLLCWLEGSTIIGVQFQHSSEQNLPHLIAADISRHQWACTITYFESFIQNPPVFHFAAMPKLVGQTWWTLATLFMLNTVCDVLTDWNCLGDSQTRTLYPGLGRNFLPFVHVLWVAALVSSLSPVTEKKCLVLQKRCETEEMYQVLELQKRPL